MGLTLGPQETWGWQLPVMCISTAGRVHAAPQEEARALVWAGGWEGSSRTWGSSSAGVKSHCWVIQPSSYSLKEEGLFQGEWGVLQI